MKTQNVKTMTKQLAGALAKEQAMRKKKAERGIAVEREQIKGRRANKR